MQFVINSPTAPLACAGLAILFVTGCGAKGSNSSAPAEQRPLFVEVTAQLGFDENPPVWPASETFNTPEIMSSGLALLDYDNAGRLDILRLCHPAANANGQPVLNRLYRQTADGKFVDVTEKAGLTTPGWATGVAVGDVDNDGLPDIYITNLGRDTFYHNNGDGTFSDWTDRAGFSKQGQWSTSATFFDYDRDGFLDLIVLHYASIDQAPTCTGPDGKRDFCGPTRYHGALATLWHNNGDGTFTDVTEKMGINIPGRGLGVVSADFNDDGWPDLFVTNDQQPNQLWINQQGRGFRDEALKRGVALNGAGALGANMGVAIGDVAGNGALDIYVTRLIGEADPLFMNQGNGVWNDKAASSGLGAVGIRHSGWACGLADFGNQGDLDLVQVGGNVARHGKKAVDPNLGPFWSDYADNNLVFKNVGKGKFVDVSSQAGSFSSRPGVTVGLALGDLDNDGRVDLVTSGIDSTIRVFHNQTPQDGAHWLSIRVLTGRRDALGAKVTVVAGGRRWLRWITTSSGYLCASDPRAHVGLGKIDHVESIEVQWVSGRRERFECPGVDRQLTVREGEGAALESH